MFTDTPPDSLPAACLSRTQSIASVRTAFMDVLGLDSVGDDDDFFDLGGDSILAVALFLQIEQCTGRHLPITTLYDASSITALSALLDRNAAAVPAPRLITFRADRPGAGPPLFIIHGLGGSVMILRDCASRIEGDFAIYGIEPKGIDGLTASLDQVEDMADLYLQDIRAVVADRPFALAGYSFGGLVAFEMATRLAAAGSAVTRLILLDSFPHPTLWAPESRLSAFVHSMAVLSSPRIWWKLLGYKRRQLRGLSLREAGWQVVRALRRAASLPFDALRTQWVHDFAEDRVALPADIAPGLTGVLLATEHVAATRRAFGCYRPGFLDRQVDFFKAGAERSISYDARRLWGGHVRRLNLRVLPIDHQGMVRTGAAMLAAELSHLLRGPGDVP